MFSNEDRSKGYFIEGTNTNCSTNPSSTDPNLPYDPDCEEISGEEGVYVVNSDKCVVLSSSYCGDSNYRAILVNDKINYNNEFIYCVPNHSDPDFLFGVGSMTSAAMLPFAVGLDSGNGCSNIRFYKEAWFEYDGYMHEFPVTTCEDAGVGKCEPIDEYYNADPPIRIYNPDYPAYDEQGLQFLAADSGDRDKVFNFTCSQFTQVVSSSGDNKAWTVRTSAAADPEFAFETPDFFSNNTTANLQKYGRQRVGVPYGAATFDANYDLLNSGPVYLQNQYYQKDNKEIFAGRPYGCTGESCQHVGYCSDNPNVMCVYYPPNSKGDSYRYINNKTCSDGGFGECKPLWTINQTGGGVYASNVLNQIFVQSYGGFTYQSGTYIPSGVGYTSYGGGGNPTITFRNLYFNEQAINEIDGTPSAGVYALKFNTFVNAEQQPLNMIYIDWGDDNQQAITGADHHPDANNPHVFYHYYDSSPVGKTVTIRAWDNWGKNVTITRTISN
mgnify:CR=1 FL=1